MTDKNVYMINLKETPHGMKQTGLETNTALIANRSIDIHILN